MTALRPPPARPRPEARPAPSEPAPPEPAPLTPGLWPVSRRPARSRLDRVVVLALCLLAFGLRVNELDGRSLWGDEGFTLARIALPVGDVLANQLQLDGLPSQDLHPALYFLLLKFWQPLAGDSFFALRFYGLAWSVLLVPLFYVAGCRLLSARAGRAAALFAALSPVYLWYAQELRMYTQLVALALLALYIFARASQLGGWWRWLLSAAATAALVYTHYSGLLVAAYELVALAVITLRVGRARRFIALLLALAVAAPVLVLMIPRLFSGAELHFNFVPLEVIAADLLHAFSLGLSADALKGGWLNALFLGVLLAGALLPLTGGRRSAWPGARGLLLGYLAVTIGLYYAVTLLKPAYQGVRHLIVVSPAFYLLLGRGIDVLSARLRPAGLLALLALVAGMAYSDAQYFRDSSVRKDDWRSLVRYIEDRAWARDVIVVNNLLVRPVIDAYSAGDELTWLTIPGLGADLTSDPAARAAAASQLEQLRAEHPRVWLVVGTPADGRDDQRFVEEWLATNMTLADQASFHGYRTTLEVRAYSSDPLIGDAPGAGFGARDLRWPVGLQLTALRARAPEYWVGGMKVGVVLVWERTAALDPERVFEVVLELVDRDGRVAAATRQPLAPFPGGLAAWSPGRLLMPGYTLVLPPGLAPGRYRLQLGLEAAGAAGGSVALPLADGSPRVELMPVDVSASYFLPDPRRIPAFTPAAVLFDNGVELLGYRLPPSGRPGQPVIVELFWRALRTAPGDAALSLELVDWLGRPLATGGGTLAPPRYPLEQWSAGQIAAGSAAVVVPGRLGPGWYDLRIALTDADRPLPGATPGWPLANRSVSVGQVYVEAWPFVSELPPGAQPLADVRFGPGVRLAGYALGGPARAGELLDVFLYWQVDAVPAAEAADLVSYVHVVDLSSGEARPLALHDSRPAGGLRPADTWRAGELIVDGHTLRLPADLARGSYALFAGLYRGATGERRPVTAAGVPQPNNELRLPDLEVRVP